MGEPPAVLADTAARLHLWSAAVRDRLSRAEGQSMVEYAFLATLITITLILVVFTIGKQTNNMVSSVSGGLGS